METQTNTSVVFLDDDEKLLDFDRVSKKRFLASYSYLTEEEYDATKNELKKLDKSATQVVVDRRIQKGMDVLERTGADISKLDFDGKEKLLNETMSELEKRWEEKKDLCVSRYGILFEINYEQLADLIKARDAFKAEKKLEQAPLEQAHLETVEEIESFMAKEAEEYVANKSDKGNFDVEKFGAAFFSESSMRIAFRDAATFGYNMAKNNITELQEKYDKLLSEHEKLQADYDKLLDNFNNLSSGRTKRQKNSGMGY